MEALTRAVSSGKVRYIGFSEWPLERIEAAWSKNVPVLSQVNRNILCYIVNRRTGCCLYVRSGISQVVWSPLAQGVLTGVLASSPVPRTVVRRTLQWARS
jgi:aryl-alcohol dehydrogenase-like predicted oxidoreductase